MTSASPISGAGSHAAPQKRLLIVEDECIVAFDLTVALQDMGYAVIATAASSDEALRAADAECPDLVLMDINITGRADGIEAGCLLRARHHIPLVYLTANVDGATLSRALATQPAGYLVKPTTSTRCAPRSRWRFPATKRSEWPGSRMSASARGSSRSTAT
jgi:DNA-binding NarL/FixJ family response regulator